MNKLSFSIIGLFTLLSVACGGGGGDSSPSNTTPDPVNPTPDLLFNKLLGFVTNTDGELISYASVGGAITGNSGVTTDEATATAAGWYLVEAEGYAPSYTRPSGEIEGINIINTTLTPIAAQAFHVMGGDVTTLSAGPGDVVTVTIQPAVFDEDVIIELTPLDPIFLDTAFAAMDTSDVLHISQPFDIRARAADDGSLVQPASGQVVEITLTDGGALGDPARLFWFDADQGQWLEQHNAACNRVDADHVSCLLDHFSQHAGGSSTPPPPSGAGNAHSQASKDTDAAYDTSAKDMAEREKNGEEPGSCEIFTPALIAAFMAEVDAAIAEAKANPGEAAKAMLFKTAARLQLVGGFSGDYDSGCDVFPPQWPHAGDPYADLMEEADNVTRKLAAKVLTNPKCPDIDSIAKVLAEAQLLGVEDIQPDLEYKYNELLDQCNIWEGRIEYSIILPRALASFDGIDYDPWYSGALYWNESHDIMLALHASSGTADENIGNFEGTDKVTTDFSDAEYRSYTSNTGCSFPVYDATIRRGQPVNGEINASFAGRLDSNNNFVADSFSAANDIKIYYGVFETGWAFDGWPSLLCIKDDDAEGSYTDIYRGQLVEQFADYQYLYGTSIDMGNHVFSNSFYDVLPSLWDILNKGPTQPAPPATETNPYPKAYYNGTEILFEAYSFGLANDMQIVMRWNIVHTDYTRGR
ncbi:MAG: hypothetical protein OEY66_06680 [Gammaproteobacteria bacterium]|nr:hypothetical protein [Gammaproteobacteria bacterium]